MPSTEPKPMNTRPPVLTSSSSPASSSVSSSSYSSLILGILNASITSFEKLSDQKTWYNVKVVTTEHASFHIFRKFEDFVQFSQHLQDAYFSTQHHYHHQHQKSSSNSNSKSNTTRKNHHHHRHHHHRSEALPKIKTRINILPTTKHIHAQRAEELDHFLKCLVKQPSHIIDSMLVLEFFGLNKEVVSRSRSIKYDKLKPDEEDHDTPASSRWKRLRCTSFLARSPPSATNLSSLCSQAANRIIPWNRNNNSTASPQPSLSTPIISKPAAASTSTVPMRKQTLKKSKSNLSVLSEVMVASPQPPPPPPLVPAPLEPVPIPQHPLDASTTNEHIPASMISLSSSTTTCHSEQLLPSPNNSRMIKIKVIYDSDNIIVIQVPRTIEFSELRTRIAQKFSDPNMFKEVELLFLDTASSISSTATLTSDIPTVLINNQQDLSNIMHSKWNKLEKVTLRCSL